MKNFLKVFGLLYLIPSVVTAQQLFKGTVTNSENQPIVRAWVEIYDEEEVLLYSDFTDELGVFETNIQIETAPEITSNRNQLSDDYYLSFVYPNPLKDAPLHFKFKSLNGEKPLISFYTFEGKKIEEGDFLTPGTYVYKAYYKASEQFKPVNGIISVTQNMKLQVDLIDFSGFSEAISDSKTTEFADTHTNARTSLISAQGTLRVEIEKDQYVTFSEEVDTESVENIDKNYLLSLAPKPTAAFEIITDEGSSIGDIIKFDASNAVGANSEDLKYFWKFGDDTKGSQVQIPHIYSEVNNYTVSLTVTGAYGAMETITKSLNISDISVPTGSVAIRGIITDAKGEPLDSASVYIHHMDSTFYTNEAGEIAFDGFTSGTTQMVKVSKTGYVKEHYNINIAEGARQGYFELSLIEREPAIQINNVELGAQVDGKNGAKVQLPTEALIHADGSIVAGSIEVYVTPVDISDDLTLEAFPGSFSGITFEGAAPLIMTFGTADYTFMQGEEELQLAAGKTATIEIPIYVEFDEFGEPLEIGDEAPMWAYDEASGNWVLEGNGIITASESSPTGMVLSGEVNHFSWWNHDIAPDPWWVIPECKINDESGLPTLEVPNGGACYIDGRIDSGPGPRGNPSTPNCCRPLPCPPGVPMIFAGSGGNGIYAGSTTASGAAGTTSTITIGMERVAGYGVDGGEIAPDTLFSAAIEEEGSIDAYTINQEIGILLNFSVGLGNNSTLEGTVEIRDPDNLPVDLKEFNSSGSANFILEITKTGDYQVIIDGTANEPGAYTVSLSSTQPIEMNTNTADSFAFSGERKGYSFEASEGQLINIAVIEEFSGGLDLSLYNEDNELLFNDYGTNYFETDVFRIPSSGFYVLELESRITDSGNNNNYTFGLSEIMDPKPFSIDSVLSKEKGEVVILGNKQYYSIDEPELGSRKYALRTFDDFSARLRILEPDTTAFYERDDIESIGTTTYNEAAKISSTNVIILPDTGQYILELDPNYLTDLNSKLGSYEIFVMIPEVKEISVNSEIKDDSISSFLGRINEFKQYTFQATEGQLYNVAKSSNIGSRTYLRLFDPDTIRLKNERSTGYVETDVFRAEKTGTYVIEIDGVNSGHQGTFDVGLSEIKEPTSITPEIPYLFNEGEVTIVGNKQYYSFVSSAPNRYEFALRTDSIFTGHLRILRPGEQEFYDRNELLNIRTTNYLNAEGDRWASTQRPTNLEAGEEYIIEFDPIAVSGRNGRRGAYEFLVTMPETKPITLNSEVEDEMKLFFDQVNHFNHFSFSGNEGDIVNIAYVDSISGRNYLRLLDNNFEQLQSVRDGQELGVRALPYTGQYTIELEGIDGDRSGGSFIMGYTSVEVPTPIDFEQPFTTIDDQIDLVGKHKFYSMNIDSLERFNFGISGLDDLWATLYFKRYSEEPFYNRPNLRSSIRSVNGNSGQTNAFSATYGGEVLFEIVPNLQPVTYHGRSRVYIGQRAIKPLALNTQIQDYVSKDLGYFYPAYRYEFTSPASNQISVNLTWEPGAQSGRVYIRIFALSGEQIYSSRTNSTGVINLPSGGNYLMELEFIDNPDGDFNVIINEE
jgi:PKD repeat protein